MKTAAAQQLPTAPGSAAYRGPHERIRIRRWYQRPDRPALAALAATGRELSADGRGSGATARKPAARPSRADARTVVRASDFPSAALRGPTSAIRTSALSDVLNALKARSEPGSPLPRRTTMLIQAVPQPRHITDTVRPQSHPRTTSERCSSTTGSPEVTRQSPINPVACRCAMSSA